MMATAVAKYDGLVLVADEECLLQRLGLSFLCEPLSCAHGVDTHTYVSNWNTPRFLLRPKPRKIAKFSAGCVAEGCTSVLLALLLYYYVSRVLATTTG